MKKTTTLITAALLALCCNASAQIIQDFSTITETRQIDIDGTGNESKTVSSANPLGYRWGGYNGGSTSDSESVRVWTDSTRASGSGAGTPVLWFRNNGTSMSGAYAYTIFDSTGGKEPDTSINLLGSGATVEIGITDIYDDGWMGGGDNGSGLPDEAGEARNTVLRLMIRDKNGDWFAGSYFAPNSAESNLGLSESGTLFAATNELTYIRTVSGDSWYPITETSNLNTFANSDETALTISGTAGSPDLSEVTGMGLYVWNLYATSVNGRFEVSSIKLTPADEPDATSKVEQLFSGITETRQIDQDGADNEDLTLSTANPLGYRWGGYNGGSTNAAESVRVWTDATRAADSGADTPVLWFRNNSTAMSGAYAYTIFDSTGGNTPDTTINLSSTGSVLKLGITDIWDGFMGNGDNGSGLPGEAGEERNTVLRLMIRDINGDWYAGDYFAPNSTNSNLGLDEDGTMFAATNEVVYIRDISGDSWYAISENANLNALAGGDETALNISTNAASPDLTQVSGMGLYVWNLYTTTHGRLEISSMTLIQPTDDYDGWADFYGLNGSDRDLDADLEPDGMDNLTEYALGGNPSTDDAATILPTGEMVTDSGTNWLSYVYTRRTDYVERGLSYTVESTPTLTPAAWTNGTPVVYVGKGPAGSNFESVTNRVNTADNDQLFLRLQIQQD